MVNVLEPEERCMNGLQCEAKNVIFGNLVATFELSATLRAFRSTRGDCRSVRIIARHFCSSALTC